MATIKQIKKWVFAEEHASDAYWNSETQEMRKGWDESIIEPNCLSGSDIGEYDDSDGYYDKSNDETYYNYFSDKRYFFFIDGDGSVCKISKSSLEDEDPFCIVIKESAVKVEDGYFYYLDKAAGVSRCTKPSNYLNEKLKEGIINLLNERNEKMTSSDIDAHLKYQDVDEVKDTCEILYHQGLINRTGNYRYFILSEDERTSSKKTNQVDIKSELKKYKNMLDEGLITQEQYDAKSNELLGL